MTKNFILCAFFVLSLQTINARADYPTVDPEAYTCAQLQQMLVQSVALNVKYPFNGMRQHVSTGDLCNVNQWANYAYIPAKDTAWCMLGYVCMKRP